MRLVFWPPDSEFIGDPTNFSEIKTTNIVMATLVLHNLLTETSTYCPAGYADSHEAHPTPGLWRTEMHERGGLIDGNRFSSNMYAGSGKVLRDTLATYFTGDGAVDWQYSMVYGAL